MLSLIELRRAAAAIDASLRGHRVERISQPDALQVVFTLYGRGDEASGARGSKRHLLVSCDPAFGRISELPAPLASAERPPAFLQFLRPRIDGAKLRSARIVGDDRELALRFDAPDGEFELLLSLLGKRSNCYVLDGGGILLAAQRPLEKTRRALSLGEPWAPPEPSKGPSQDSAATDRFADVDEGELLLAIERAYEGSESGREAEGLAARIEKALRKERKAASKRLERIERELAEADSAGDLQRHGELLKGALGRVKKGMSEIEVADYETGDPVTIPLDPTKTPQQNLEATFKRYQKFVRRLTKAGSQAEEAREGVERIDALEAERAGAAEADDGGAALAALAERADVARLVRKHVPARPAESGVPQKKAPRGPFADLPRKLHPRRYVSADGLEIWVGRSDEGNDYLSTRLARGKDLFFHLDGAPGSHVVLRTEGRADPPSESVIDACELAVQFSKFKNAGSADVHVVPIKNVKKPKGAKRGLVYVTGGKSIHLRREARRLERLLASRIDD